MAEKDPRRSWTILELLNWTTPYFEKAGIENPRLNAELLLGNVLEMERIMLYAHFEDDVDEASRREFRRLIKQRARHKPLQYLLGEARFYGREFRVTPATLIPRQETETVVEKILEKIPPDEQESRAAEVGTGSGVIGVTLCLERPNLHVVASDSSADALAVAKENARRHGVEGRVQFVEGDLVAPLVPLRPSRPGGFDLVASNPPYVPAAQVESLDSEVKDFEPRQSLDGGKEGLEVIARLVSEAPKVLQTGGWLILEIGADQSDKVRALLEAEGEYRPDSVEVAPDAFGRARVVAASKANSNGE